jgi:molecular chaperone DnaK (HSP70)
MRLGVDFGTTRTVIAAAERGRYPLATFEAPHGFCDYLPSIASSDNGKLSFGWDAQRGLYDGAADAPTIRSVKRRVTGLFPEDPVGMDDLSALDLTTHYLRHVRSTLIEKSNFDLDDDEPLEAMIGVPANASSRQRFLTMEAFRRAGFSVLGMVSEPTAAAIEFAHRNLGAIGRRTPKRYVVVYDLGGGTFDASAVSLEGRRFDLLANEGITELGGNDFDEIILKLALEAAGLRKGLPQRLQTRLLELCRQAKEGMNSSSRRLLIDFSSVLDVPEIVLEAALVSDRCQPLIDRTIELTQRLFQRLLAHGIDPENARELGAIYLVGGGSAFVPVGRTLRAQYKRKIQIAPQPHAATAIGLAIAADPDSTILVRETVTRYFGVWRESEGGRDKVFDLLFAKNADLNSEASSVVERRYRPAHAVGYLRYLECSELNAQGQPSGDLSPWGEVLFPYDPALRKGGNLEALSEQRRPDLSADEIVEVYRYLPDGTVKVEIANSTRGYEHSYVIGNREADAG